MPSAAMACMVRVEPKVHEFATLITEMVITAFMTDGRPLIPASVIARTNGEAFVLLFDAPRSFSESDGTTKPTRKRLRM